MITVDILYHEDCTHYPTAIRYVKEVLAEEGIEATINEINVTKIEPAQELDFVGSPTIRVNGEDIESEVEQQRGHGHGSCRMYHYGGKVYVTPHKEFIRTALKKYR
ncbi:MAG: DF family (seleno)protein [Halobacteriota archaeon]